ncbi:MAG TPA: 6-phosphogluconolactonase [Burkholderiaceae bacterium]|nr:6-phosphogluconolactonase [Burkholderiaceae bacterium]
MAITESGAALLPRIERFKSVQALSDAVAGRVAGAVMQGVQARGAAQLVFSGGSTPEVFLPQVASLDLPWEKVTVMLADERWVDEDHPHSNAAMLRRTLLSHEGPSRAKFVPLKNNAPSAGAGVGALRAGLPSSLHRHDLVLLGMGNDAHFASLFPGTPGLAALLDPANTDRLVAIPAPTTAAPAIERISMTYAELMHARSVALVIQGQTKLTVLENALRGADPIATPAAALQDVDVLWCP